MEVSEVIQGFAPQEVGDAKQSTVMRVVADDVQVKMYRRKTDLERYFQDQPVQR